MIAPILKFTWDGSSGEYLAQKSNCKIRNLIDLNRVIGIFLLKPLSDRFLKYKGSKP